MTLPLPADVPAPSINLDSQGFWQAASRGELRIGHCSSCDKHFFYPRNFCPFCLSPDAELVSASGRGEIYALTVIRRIERPYALAYVTLDEGPSMLTNIVADNLDDVRIGQRVKVVFAPSEGGSLVPMFHPI